MSTAFETAFATDQRRSLELQARQLLLGLVQFDQYVGEVFSLGYEDALVVIHDFNRQQVGGIPSLSFLVATRLKDSEPIDFTKEDSAVILLRVMDAADLPNEQEARRIRTESAQRVSGELGLHWDEQKAMDAATANELSFAGIRCRVLGTFYADESTQNADSNSKVLRLRFGADISNYYPNRGLKVYKPRGSALAAIVNFRDPLRTDALSKASVDIGEVRYASTNRGFQGISNVAVSILPADLLAQKSALFGMTRTGKSNTTKIILQSVFNLRFLGDASRRIGQLVFDPNGEYANENVQDPGPDGQKNAIRNVWRENRNGTENDVVVYGLRPVDKDPRRRLMLLNFLDPGNLQVGKDIINGYLADEQSTYMKNFSQIGFEQPDPRDGSRVTRYRRRVLAYRALLVKAGFAASPNLAPRLKNLFGRELIQALKSSSSAANAAEHQSAARILQGNPTWDQVALAMQYLQGFIKEGSKSGYDTFDSWYINKPRGSGEPWADEDLKKILEMYAYPNGVRRLGAAVSQHTDSTTGDYADAIYSDLLDGRLVIVDQSSGDELLNRSGATRIMARILRGNQAAFTSGSLPKDILVFVEEAHTLLPAGTEMDLKDTWVRTAKEGAKYRLGMVYATQEVSSIQQNILKNTTNWFIGHLNNTDETRELVKFYDFKDFELSIRRAEDRGFLRVKTMANRFVIPVQIRKFEIRDAV